VLLLVGPVLLGPVLLEISPTACRKFLILDCPVLYDGAVNDLHRGDKPATSAHGQSHGLPDPAQHLDQCVDRELRGLLIDNIGDPRARHHQDLRSVRLLELMFDDPVRQLDHQLLLEQARVVDLLARRGVQLLGFRGREAQFQEEVRSRLGDVADFGINRHRLFFLALTTAR